VESVQTLLVVTSFGLAHETKPCLSLNRALALGTLNSTFRACWVKLDSLLELGSLLLASVKKALQKASRALVALLAEPLRGLLV
jgi:hypothetical protein